MSIRKRQWMTRKGEAKEAWIADYVDQHGNRHLKTFATQKAAKAWTVSALHEVQRGTHTPASVSETVEEAWRLWLAECEAKKLECGTIRQRRQHLERHVKPFIGRMRLANLTKQKVYEFDRKLRENGRSTAMRRKVVTNLATMLDFAQTRSAVAQNVAEKVRIKTDTRDALRDRSEPVLIFPHYPN